MDGDEMEAAQLDPEGPLGGNPRTASTLSVWKDFETFRAFTHGTVHRVFMERGHEWHIPRSAPNLVMWYVAEGYLPSVAEAAARLDHLTRNGASEHAFDWDFALSAVRCA